MLIHFNKDNRQAYISISETYRGNFEIYLYMKSKSIDLFLFEDHFSLKDIKEIKDYILREDPNVNIDNLLKET